MIEKLTDLERAAIALHLIAGENNRLILYTIAVGAEHVKKLKESSLKVMYNNWFNSHKIQNGIRYYSGLLNDREARAVEKFKRELETETTKGNGSSFKSTDVNFLNPDEFLKFANQQANEIKDEKERREYLKMIANLMNYKESDQEQTDIQRFYTPVLCENCEIYNKCKSCKLSECPKVL